MQLTPFDVYVDVADGGSPQLLRGAAPERVAERGQRRERRALRLCARFVLFLVRWKVEGNELCMSEAESA